ncbi:MAG: hypothetical protein AAF741_14195 [Bacteroidota bacterium]
MISVSLANLNNVAREVQRRNVEKGFYEKEKNIGEMIALMHSELSEALEADRKNRYAKADNETWDMLDESPSEADFMDLFRETVKDTFEDELADAFIRILDMAGYLKIDLERHVEYKMRYNQGRQKYHGKRY